MSLFVIGDPHLSLGTDKPMDVFRGWADYTARLEKSWRAVVDADDTVVLPGDISWAMKLADTRADFRFLDALPGTKILLKGNHDYWWETMRKMNAFLETEGFTTLRLLFNNAYRWGDYALCGTRGWFYDAETTDVERVINREAGRLRMSIEAGLALGGEPLVFLHYPPLYEDRVCTEIYDVLVAYKIKHCWFGHIHGEGAAKYAAFERDGIRFSLVSADFLSFCPKLIQL